MSQLKLCETVSENSSKNNASLTSNEINFPDRKFCLRESGEIGVLCLPCLSY